MPNALLDAHRANDEHVSTIGRTDKGGEGSRTTQRSIRAFDAQGVPRNLSVQRVERRGSTGVSL